MTHDGVAAATTRTPAPAAGALLSVRDLQVEFGTGAQRRRVVDGLSFDVAEGRSLAIVGESGSGKTVSMRSLLGLLPGTASVSGAASFDGVDVLNAPPQALRRIRGGGIGMVFQNAMSAFNPTLTLKRQLTEHLRWHRICGRKEAVTRAVEALDRVGIPEPQRRIGMYPFQLSGGMRQRAMIAMAIIGRPKLLIADEPTTAVDVTVQRQVLDLLRDLQQDGLSLIMITHDLGVARYSCQDVIVMRHGQMIERGEMTTFADEAKEEYSRHLVDSALDIADSVDRPHLAADAAPLMQGHELTKVFSGTGGETRAVDEVSIDIPAGRTVGLVGESGSGKSTLARLLMRLVDPTGGDLVFDGKDLIADREASTVLRREAQMIFQDPYGSLLPHLSISANVAEPLRLHGVGTKQSRLARAAELLDRVGIDSDRMTHYPRQFSGGQQQRVAIARALILEPKLVVCDEPTSALDVSIQAQILDLLSGLQRDLGIAMLFVTHNLAVAQRLSDRVVVMARGRVMEEADTDDLFGDPRHMYTRALLAAALPVRADAPPTPDGPIDLSGAELVEVAPGHLVRLTR